MTKGDPKIFNIVTPGADSGNSYVASERFSAYLRAWKTAVRLGADDSSPEIDWLRASDISEDAAKHLAIIRAADLSAVFEKLFIWRTQCFEGAPTEYVCFSDVFPLSVYFDVKGLLGNPKLCPGEDELLFETLRRCCEPSSSL